MGVTQSHHHKTFNMKSIIITGVLIMSLFNCSAKDKPLSKRCAAVAGSFYPSDSVELCEQIGKYISYGKALCEHPQMLISPHAGYIFSGEVAGVGYASIDRNVNKVILIGPSHTKAFDGLSIPDVDLYETPLGVVTLNKDDVTTLRKSSLVNVYPDAHEKEHNLEVQIPFLQYLLSDFTIIPIICGQLKNYKEIADLIYPVIDKKTLVVLSSDLSHFHSNEDAKKIDHRSITTILDQNKNGFIDGCGEVPIRIGFELAEMMNVFPHLLDARNSFETAPGYGSEDRVVGYTSIVFLSSNNDKSLSPQQNKQKQEIAENNSISDIDKKFMLTLARDALNCAVSGKNPPVPQNIPTSTKEIFGCFVTLTKGKNKGLRGCIGYIEGVKPLYEAIIDMAKNAALKDHRFSPVTPTELDDINIEISVLSRAESFSYIDRDDLLSKINPNVDGIILKLGFCQSTFLPQVWEQLPDKVSFLEHLAIKAGLGKNEWEKAEYKKYQAIHFQEK